MNKTIFVPWVALALVNLMLGAMQVAGPDVAIANWGYQRAVILDGELWRVLTGHLVHYSHTHLLWDVLAFAVLATLTERQLGHAGLVKLLLLLAAVISASLLLFAPAMATYAGISGINYGLLVFVALKQWWQTLRRIDWTPVAGFAGVIGLVGLILLQANGIESPFTADLSGVRVAWQAHLAGVLTAALFVAAQRYYRLGFPWASG